MCLSHTRFRAGPSEHPACLVWLVSDPRGRGPCPFATPSCLSERISQQKQPSEITALTSVGLHTGETEARGRDQVWAMSPRRRTR